MGSDHWLTTRRLRAPLDSDPKGFRVMNKLVPLFAGFIGAFMMGICVQSQRTAAPPVDPNAMWAFDTRAIASWIGIPQEAITSVTIVNQ